MELTEFQITCVIIGRMVCAAVAFVSAGMLAYSGKSGWRLMMLAGFLLGGILLSGK